MQSTRLGALIGDASESEGQDLDTIVPLPRTGTLLSFENLFRVSISGSSNQPNEDIKPNEWKNIQPITNKDFYLQNSPFSIYLNQVQEPLPASAAGAKLMKDSSSLISCINVYDVQI